eukprot:TRINITY_DN22468_c0_g1_i1.p1 TRINITY_DN22468_c0_g1~~TRINITY_DN22468_c0_g1_i1.p1  ORF type:complete len:276 (+),score=47.93 TRINITY_DN22468_c0_g1_i1:37-864(+)
MSASSPQRCAWGFQGPRHVPDKNLTGTHDAHTTVSGMRFIPPVHRTLREGSASPRNIGKYGPRYIPPEAGALGAAAVDKTLQSRRSISRSPGRSPGRAGRSESPKNAKYGVRYVPPEVEVLGAEAVLRTPRRNRSGTPVRGTPVRGTPGSPARERSLSPHSAKYDQRYVPPSDGLGAVAVDKIIMQSRRSATPEPRMASRSPGRQRSMSPSGRYGPRYVPPEAEALGAEAMDGNIHPRSMSGSGTPHTPPKSPPSSKYWARYVPSKDLPATPPSM